MYRDLSFIPVCNYKMNKRLNLLLDFKLKIGPHLKVTIKVKVLWTRLTVQQNFKALYF